MLHLNLASMIFLLRMLKKKTWFVVDTHCMAKSQCNTFDFICFLKYLVQKKKKNIILDWCYVTMKYNLDFSLLENSVFWNRKQRRLRKCLGTWRIKSK